MNQLKIVITVLFLSTFYLGNLQAQFKISGVVKNNNHENISYCSLGIPNSTIGTISNDHGFFELDIPQNFKDSLIVFSAVGYEKLLVNASKLINRDTTLVLSSKVISLNGITVSAKKLKNKTLGKTKRPFLSFSRMFDEKSLSIEQGNIFRIPDYCKLNSYGFHIITSSRFKQVTLKMNIYKVEDGKPTASLINNNIIFKTSKTGWQTIKLKDYGIRIKNTPKICISLQLVDYEPLDNVGFNFGISASKTVAKNLLFRFQSQSKWEKLAGNFLANINFDYLRNYQEDSLDNCEPDTIKLDHQTAKLVEFYKFGNEAKQTNYGKNKKGKYICLDSVNIYYETYGEGEPLVLLHGNGGSISDYYKQIPILSKSYQVIAIDTRGQGRSIDSTSTEYNYQLFADDLKKVLQALSLKKVSIVGWSDGGNTGLMFNMKYPEMVKKLVTIGANLNPEGVDEELIRTLKERLNGVKNRKDGRLIRLMLNCPHIKPLELAKIENKVLVIAGEEDVIKLEHTKLISSSIQQSQLEIIPDASHYIPWEKPKLLNKKICDFMKN